MSLVPQFVKIGNLWYKGPAVYDESKEWFLCFDDEDPPEIVIKSSGQLSKTHRKEKIQHFLKTAKIRATIISHSVCGSRLFPPNWKGFHPSIQAFLKVDCNIDITNLKVKHDGISEDLPPHGEFVAYDFNSHGISELERLSKWLNPFGD